MGRPAEFDRDEAITIALDAFWRDGYDASTVVALSQQIGISRSSFYNSFGSRERLFDLALDRYMTGAPERSWDAIEEGLRISTLLTRTFRELCRLRAADEDARGCLVVNIIGQIGRPGHPVAKLIAGAALGNVERLKQILTRAVILGELPEATDIDSLALALQSLLSGINTLSKVIRDEERLWLAARLTLEGLGLFDPDGLSRANSRKARRRRTSRWTNGAHQTNLSQSDHQRGNSK